MRELLADDVINAGIGGPEFEGVGARGVFFGGVVGQMTQDGGPDLIYIPANQRGGWVLGGLAGRPNGTIPNGYDNQVSGECRIPDVTPATHRSWGAVKALYR